MYRFYIKLILYKILNLSNKKITMINTNTDMNSPAYQREKKQTFLICVIVIIVIILLFVFL